MGRAALPDPLGRSGVVPPCDSRGRGFGFGGGAGGLFGLFAGLAALDAAGVAVAEFQVVVFGYF